MREILPGQWRCGHSPACTCLTESVAQSQRSGVTTGGCQGQRFITLRGVLEPSLRPYSTHDLPSWVFSSPTFSNPSKWLGQNSWQQQEKQTVGCGALSHQLEISLWKDSLLLTALSTNHRARQSPGTQSSCPLTLPAVVGLFCLGILERMGLFLTGQAAGLGWGL